MSLRILLVLVAALLVKPVYAQRITLHNLMSFHSMADTDIDQQLRNQGWRYLGIQRDIMRKPRMYSLHEAGSPAAQLFLYQYQKRPLCKVELVSKNIEVFNATIRDSMNAYGFVPDTEKRIPDDESLQVTSSVSYVTTDGSKPVRALILYYEERRHPKVSLTIYDEE